MDKPRLSFALEQCRSNVLNFLRTAGEVLASREIAVFYAVKANPHPKVGELIHALGIGAEVITEREFSDCALPGNKIVANGHYKSDAFIDQALRRGAAMLNVESVAELARIDAMAQGLGIHHLDIGLRPQIATGRKIGIPRTDLSQIAAMPRKTLRVRGLHFHAGWNVKEDSCIESCLKVLNEFQTVLANGGHTVDTWNCGGSLPFLRLRPLVETIGENQAPSFLERIAKRSFFREGLGAGIDELVSDVSILRPMRDESPS